MEFKTVSTKKPTYLNGDALLGGLAGLLLTGFNPWGAAAGTAIGSFFGKRHMETELKEGHTVREPSMLNKKAAIGGMIGIIAGAVVGTLVSAAVAGTALAFAPAAAIIAGGAVLGLAVGALKGGASGKSEMEREYSDAMNANQTGNTVQQTQTLVVDHGQAQGKSFTDTLAAERAQQSSAVQTIYR